MAPPRSQLIVDVGGSHTRFYIRHAGNPLTTIQDLDSRLRGNDDIHHRLVKTMPSRPDQLYQQIQSCLRFLRHKPNRLLVGMRGVWTKEERSFWRKKLGIFRIPASVVSDIELAHHMAFGSGPGIILNAGTGSIAYGLAPSGKTARAGGLGPLLGDEGSAFWIGKEYLKLTYRKDRKYLKIRYLSKNSKVISNISKLGFQVLKQAYSQGKKENVDIKNRALFELMLLILFVKKELNWRGSIPIALHGGIFDVGSFKQEFVKRINLESAKFQWIPRSRPFSRRPL